MTDPDLSICPKCQGPADNGHDRELPPNPYWCTKCTKMSEGIKEFINNTPSYSHLADYEKNNMLLQWGKPGVGFGELYFFVKDGKTHIENEGMQKEFIKEMLCLMVDEAELED